jgi:hypothetical protein
MPTSYLDDEEDTADAPEEEPVPIRKRRPVLPQAAYLDEDEDGDPTSYPPIARGPAVGVPPVPSADPIYQRLQELSGKMPIRPKPKWWQGLAAGAFGAGAGWSNAASRTRHPIDIGAVAENITAPGYGEEMKRFRSEVAPIEAQAQIAAQRAKNESQIAAERAKAGQAEATSEYRRAGAEAARKHGDYWAHRAEAEQKQWVPQKDGSVLNTITGERRGSPQTPDDKYKEAKALGATDEEARAWALGFKPAAKTTTGAPFFNVPPGGVAIDRNTGKVIYSNPKPPKEVDPDVAANREQLHDQREAQDLDRIANSKETNEQKLHASRAREVAAAIARTASVSEQDLAKRQPAVFAEINKRYAQQLQRVQNNFADALRRRGRPAEDWDVDPLTLEYRQRSAAPPLPAPPPPARLATAAPATVRPSANVPAPAPPKYLKFAKSGNQRMGFSAVTRKWEPVQP